MAVAEIILSVIYVILGVAISAVILMQEGKSQGLGALGGIADSYWGKNKGRSMEGALEKFTKYGAIVFMLITIAMNMILKSQGA
ncbi:MAG: preprotein translocase subunit SecG [Clostridium sp.]|nr:preprotein translocase subunit SecG [Enterocloster asparagiformis]MCD7907416.1 preprotein translocase subunit SecG [Clostridium sp.]